MQKVHRQHTFVSYTTGKEDVTQHNLSGWKAVGFCKMLWQTWPWPQFVCFCVSHLERFGWLRGEARFIRAWPRSPCYQSVLTGRWADEWHHGSDNVHHKTDQNPSRVESLHVHPQTHSFDSSPARFLCVHSSLLDIWVNVTGHRSRFKSLAQATEMVFANDQGLCGMNSNQILVVSTDSDWLK